MTENWNGLDLNVTEMLHEDYVPSESERKKAILCYSFMWIIILLSKKEITNYLYFHLKQAIWWWTIFFLSFIVWVIFFFLPYFKIIPFLMLLVLFVIWWFFVKYAWEWKYIVNLNGNEKIFLPFFAAIWWWMLNLLEVKFDIK